LADSAAAKAGSPPNAQNPKSSKPEYFATLSPQYRTKNRERGCKESQEGGFIES
jgi:hypothetical protein